MNFRRRPLTDEFMLVVACARWSFAGGEPDAVHRLASTVGWDRFVALSRRHRVQGLVWHCLRNHEVSMPAGTKERLAADAAAVAAVNLRAAVQSRRLLDRFSSAGVPLLFIKGLTLSKLAYGDPFLKMGWDVDVLIPGDAVELAAAELRGLGFDVVIPAANADPRIVSKWHRRRKESVWRSSDGLHVELHTRLADSSDLIPSIGIRSPRQEVVIAPGIALPTLATEDLFAYLCVHGASSAWFRLKWATDLAALLHSCTPQRIEQLYDYARQKGAGRAVDQALILASHIYGIPHVDGMDRGVSLWLADVAWGQMLRESEPTQELLGTIPIHFTQLLLHPGIPFKVKEFARQLFDWAGPLG